MSESTYTCLKCVQVYSLDELKNSMCPTCHGPVIEDAGNDQTIRAEHERRQEKSG